MQKSHYMFRNVLFAKCTKGNNRKYQMKIPFDQNIRTSKYHVLIMAEDINIFFFKYGIFHLREKHINLY